MTWQDILLKQTKFENNIDGWIKVFESQKNLTQFKENINSLDERTIASIKNTLRNKKYGEEIVEIADLDGENIFGQPIPERQSQQNRLSKLVQRELNQINELILGAGGLDIDDLIDRIVPRLKVSEPDFLSIEKEINNYLKGGTRVTQIRDRLFPKLRGKVQQISSKIESFAEPNTIKRLATIFKITKGKYIIKRPELKKKLESFYETIIQKGDPRKIQRSLAAKTRDIYDHLYLPNAKTRDKPLTLEFSKALQKQPATLEGFEEFMYVKVPTKSVNKDSFYRRIEHENHLYIPFEDAQEVLDDEAPNGLGGVVDNIGSGQRIVVNGEPILGKKLPLEKDEVLDDFKDKDKDLSESLRYWAFSETSKVKDWGQLAFDILSEFLKDLRKNKNLLGELIKIGIVEEVES